MYIQNTNQNNFKFDLIRLLSYKFASSSDHICNMYMLYVIFFKGITAYFKGSTIIFKNQHCIENLNPDKYIKIKENLVWGKCTEYSRNNYTNRLFTVFYRTRSPSQRHGQWRLHHTSTTPTSARRSSTLCRSPVHLPTSQRPRTRTGTWLPSRGHQTGTWTLVVGSSKVRCCW